MNRTQRTPAQSRDHAITAVVGLAQALLRWPVESQLGSRRNALLASTRLTEASRQRRDVEEYLERLEGRLEPSADRSARTAAVDDTSERGVI